MTKTKATYKVDIANINGKGDFPCPICQAVISPDDIDEKVYKIIEVRCKGPFLDEVYLQCNKCRSIISMTEFDTLKKEEPVEN